jgi:hypothetical protein
MESHSSTLVQVEDKGSGLEDKMDTKEETENPYAKDKRAVKRICKHSMNPSKGKN